MNYRGDNIKYAGIHTWLIKTFGRAPTCEMCNKIGFKNNNKWGICWALKKGCEYKRRRENFFGLCSKCHRAYDDTEVWRRNISLGKLGKKRSVKQKKSKSPLIYVETS